MKLQELYGKRAKKSRKEMRRNSSLQRPHYCNYSGCNRKRLIYRKEHNDRRDKLVLELTPKFMSFFVFFAFSAVKLVLT